ncbi:MAG: prominin family protein [candidate division Zixibacteria bacterium]|nr:prominin family protein [candidate division Zixibacteria bacterium]
MAIVLVIAGILILVMVLNFLDKIPGSMKVKCLGAMLALIGFGIWGYRFMFYPPHEELVKGNDLLFLIKGILSIVAMIGLIIVVPILLLIVITKTDKKTYQHVETARSLSTGQWKNVLVTSYWDENTKSRQETRYVYPGEAHPPKSGFSVFGEKEKFIE